MGKNVKILVCCHKEDIMATQAPYFPIQVGKALSDVDLGIQGDNTGENISEKNRNYCELTGIYWAWKNLKDTDIIGLCHYRRYFDFHKQARALIAQEVYRTSDFDSIDLSVPEEVTANLKEGTAIVARRQWWMSNLFTVYCQTFISDDIRTLLQVIKERHPSYVDSFYYIMYMQNKKSQANMFIMTWHDFDAYCTWLFDILGEVEQRIDISHYSPYQARIYGFMGEFLLNIWLYKNKMHQIRRPLLWFTDEQERPSQLKVLVRNIRGWLATKLICSWTGKFEDTV